VRCFRFKIFRDATTFLTTWNRHRGNSATYTCMCRFIVSYCTYRHEAIQATFTANVSSPWSPRLLLKAFAEESGDTGWDYLSLHKIRIPVMINSMLKNLIALLKPSLFNSLTHCWACVIKVNYLKLFRRCLGERGDEVCFFQFTLAGMVSRVTLY
jgi:hypothetical protein